MAKPRTVYVGVETFGLLDFRQKSPVCIAPERAAGFLDGLIKTCVDNGQLSRGGKPSKGWKLPAAKSGWGRTAGDSCVVGDWYAVHEGMVDGPHKTEESAERARKKNFGDCTITDDPGRLWIVHAVHRVSHEGFVTHAILKAKVW